MAHTRPDDELRAQSTHVFWHLRQVLRLAVHLERCRRAGRTVMHDALDAAALEAFAVSARALVEFFWDDHKVRRDGRRRYPNDARAIDWFDGETTTWNPGPKPAVLGKLTERVGWGVAHVSYRRIDPHREWGWQHLDVAHHLASRFYDFASDAPIARVTADFHSGVYAEVMAYREQTDRPELFSWLHDRSDPLARRGTPRRSLPYAIRPRRFDDTPREPVRRPGWRSLADASCEKTDSAVGVVRFGRVRCGGADRRLVVL